MKHTVSKTRARHRLNVGRGLLKQKVGMGIQLTFHVDALFFPEGGTELLDLCRKASLDVLRGQDFVS